MNRRTFLSCLLALALAPKLVRMEAEPMLEHFGPAFPMELEINPAWLSAEFESLIL